LENENVGRFDRLIPRKEWKSEVFRLRAGSYRIIFMKNDRRLLILIIRIGHRKEIYLTLK